LTRISRDPVSRNLDPIPCLSAIFFGPVLAYWGFRFGMLGD